MKESRPAYNGLGFPVPLSSNPFPRPGIYRYMMRAMCPEYMLYGLCDLGFVITGCVSHSSRSLSGGIRFFSSFSHSRRGFGEDGSTVQVVRFNRGDRV